MRLHAHERPDGAAFWRASWRGHDRVVAASLVEAREDAEADALRAPVVATAVPAAGKLVVVAGCNGSEGSPAACPWSMLWCVHPDRPEAFEDAAVDVVPLGASPAWCPLRTDAISVRLGDGVLAVEAVGDVRPTFQAAPRPIGETPIEVARRWLAVRLTSTLTEAAARVHISQSWFSILVARDVDRAKEAGGRYANSRDLAVLVRRDRDELARFLALCGWTGGADIQMITRADPNDDLAASKATP